MITEDVQVGSTLTNGDCAFRVIEKAQGRGWIGLYISFGSGLATGSTCLIELEEIAQWRHVPFEWTEITDAGIEERYVWSPDWRCLRHEIRAAHADAS